ncbi:MAG: hypothetical protein KGL53_17270 [Elusimicrobia bacterium]|nr:hypothetical protein [Elusimicrobiota bacterium]
MAKRLTVLLALALAACSPPSIAIRHGYDFQTIRRVAVLAFRPARGRPETGALVSDLFAQELLKAGYDVVEREDAGQVVREQAFQVTGAVDPRTAKKLGKLLGVDALVVGTVSDFQPARSTVVTVPVTEEEDEPIMGTRVRRVRQGDEWVTVQESYVRGTRRRVRRRRVAQRQVIDATVGVAVRMVSVETGQVLWSGSSSEDGLTAEDAAASLAHRIVHAVKSTWPK